MDRIFRLNKTEQLLAQFILLAWAAVVLIPMGTAILNALKPSVGEVYRAPLALPSKWTFTNFVDAWVGANFGSYFLNSVILSSLVVIIVCTFSAGVAFVLVRMPFKGSVAIYFCFMIGVIIPIRLALAPLFTIVKELGLLDSLIGLALVQSASMMPVTVFILTAFLKSVPSELEDAARMDGALPFQIFGQIVVPLIRPALATVALLSFVQAWNEYFLPLIFLQSRELYPLTLGMTEFRTQFAVQWHMMFAGILIMLAPTVIAFLLASRQFIEGLTSGGVKE